ncbi:MAG: thioredoxin fold domain-containing protein [Opitutae bacterium]|nr:thioredoxin fold domain-containing protein [Opitutae bacterium]
MSAVPVNFETDVLARSERTPVLVDFWAPWCGPCKMLGPVVERLAAEAAGRWLLVKVNTDEQTELAAQFQIRGIPNLKLFHRRAVVAELAGALPEPQLRAWLAEHLPTPKRETMARARELLQTAHAEEAAALLRPLAAAAPDDAELAALTARALVFAEPAEAVALIAEQAPGGPWDDTVTLVHTFARLFALEENHATALPPSPLRDRYVDGIRSLRRQRFADALRSLIGVLEEKPGYADGQTKAACLAIFKHLGLRHPITEEFTRAYSMAVNV